MADEKVSLELDAKVSPSILAGTASLAEMEKEFERLRSEVRQMGPDFAAGSAHLDQLAAAIQKAKLGAGQVSTAMVQTGQSFKMSGQGVMQLAYFMDDLQYGMRGVVNNVPMLLSSFGVGAGLAGAISIVAIGVGVLTEKWSSFNRALSGSGTESEAERMEKLAKATEKTAAQQQALAKYQATKERATALQKEGTQEDQERGEQVKSIFKAPGSAREFVEKVVEKAGDTIYTKQEKGQRDNWRLMAQDAGISGDAERQKHFQDLLDAQKRTAQERLRQSVYGTIAAAEGGDATARARLSGYMENTTPDDERSRAKLGAKHAAAGLTDALIEEAKGMETGEGFKLLASEQERLDRVFKQGSLSAKEYEDASERVRKAYEALSSEAQQTSEKLMETADAEAKKRQEEYAAREKADPYSAGNMNERRAGKYTDLYGQAMGGSVAYAIMRRMQRGQSGDEAAEDLSSQIEGRLHAVPQSIRRQVANQIARNAQMQAEDYQAQSGVGSDLMAQQVSMNLAPKGTAMRAMQMQWLRQNAAAAQQQAAQFDKEAGKVNDFQAKAGENIEKGAQQFADAVQQLTQRGIVVTL